MFAEPGNRIVELRLESSICKHCGTIIERFPPCEGDGHWHHARTGEPWCVRHKGSSVMRSPAVELVLLPPLYGDDPT